MPWCVALNLLRADCDSGFLGILGGSMVYPTTIVRQRTILNSISSPLLLNSSDPDSSVKWKPTGIAFAIHSEGYLAYVKVPRDLSYDVYKPIDTRVQRE